MEYEMEDDPQGQPEPPEGERDGGVREPLAFRANAPTSRRAGEHRHAPPQQMGESV